MKTRKEYTKELITLDKQLTEIQEQMKNLKSEFIELYGIFEWDELFDCLRHTV